MKSPMPSGDWQPPLWVAFGFCIVFAIVGIIAVFLDASAHALAVNGGLFALCFRTAFRRPELRRNIEPAEILDDLFAEISRRKVEAPSDAELTAKR